MSPEGFLYLLISICCIGLAIGHSINGERCIFGRHPSAIGTGSNSTPEELEILKARAVWHLVSLLLLTVGALFFLMAQKPLSTPVVSAILAAAFLAAAIELCAISRGRYILWVPFAAMGTISWFATGRFVQQSGWAIY